MQQRDARWVPSDRRQVEIHRLLGVFGPVPATFFADACQLLAADPPMASATHLVGHLLRELESALREILRPMVPAKQLAGLVSERGECGRVERNHKEEIDAIATALGFPADDEVRSLWKSLELHRVGHRGSPLGPRRVDEEFRSLWDTIQVLLLRLGRKFESSYSASLPLIDALAGNLQPNRGDMKQLQALPHSLVALERFFTQAGPGWFPLLRKKGYLSDPLPLEVADDGTVAYVRWPAGRYLVRMAAEPTVQRDVIEVASVLQTDNPQAHECVAEAALVLPAVDAARLAPKIASFLASRYKWTLPLKVRELIVRLAREREADAALLLLRSLLETETGRDGWRLAGLVSEFIPAVFPQLGLDGLTVLGDLLDQAIDERLPDGRTWKDQSYAWRPTLEGGRDHDRTQTLTSALRDATVLAASSDPPGVAAVVQALARRERAIFHRLALHVLRHAPDAHLINERIGRRELFDDPYVEREYTRLLQDHAASLPSEVQARVLGWIEAGPQKRGTAPDAADRWRLWQLARWGDALPQEQTTHYQELVERFGEPATPRPVEGWVGPTAPMNTDELLAMGDDDLIAFLRSWQPTSDLFAPSRAGLQRNLRELAAANPERLAALAPAFAELHPAYAAGVLAGLTEAAGQERAFPWQAVLELARAVIAEPRLPSAQPEGQDDEPTHGWQDTRMELARLLEAGLRHDLIPDDADSDIFEILAALAADPDPSLADEQRHDAALTGPFILDLNTVRGATFHAIMSYAWWRKTKTPPDQTPSLNTRLRALLDRNLDPAYEPTRTIRSVYGHYFPLLLACDHDWAHTHVEAVFPHDPSLAHLCSAAWEHYLLFNQGLPDVYELLAEHYQETVTRLAAGDLQQASEQVDDPLPRALTKHVLDLYARGAVGLEPGSLIHSYLERAPAGLRTLLIDMAGTGVTTVELPPVVLERLQRLWEWRREILRQRADADLEELKGFGWWFSSGKFDDDWALDQLRGLFADGGIVEPDHLVAERLAALRNKRLSPVVECLSLLIDAAQRPAAQPSWFVMDARGDIRAILQDGIKAADPETRRHARETVNRLIARGHSQFQRLLS